MMRCYWLSVLLFAAIGLAETVGYWTLHNFQLFCDSEGITCAYHFSISQDKGATPGNQCLFTVDGKDGKPANQTDFQALNCLGNDQYKVNGGWSQEGFVTIVVTNINEGLYAFFAYSSATIAQGKTVDEQTRLAYKLGTFDISSNAVIPAKRSGVEWRVLNLQQGRHTKWLGIRVLANPNTRRLQRTDRRHRVDICDSRRPGFDDTLFHHHQGSRRKRGSSRELLEREVY
jgi:hypothetical protein